ncbi:MAG: DUF935 family protein [Magnetococcales bacterium]|nr:DUF935 family protein [Magnetococcales bacterium]
MTDNATKPKVPDLAEVATLELGRDITRGVVDPLVPLLPQDTMLQSRAKGDYAQYETILQDDQVASTFQQRRLAVISRPWTVDPGAKDKPSQMAADFLKEILEHIHFDAVTDRMLYGVFYGFAVAECLWARDGSNITLDALKVRKQRRFRFDMDGQPRLMTTDDTIRGMILPERKFWCFATGADNDNEPYGLGLAHWLYWPVYFKRAAMKSWSVVLDRFGAPSTIGYFPSQQTTEAEKQKLHKAIQSIHSQGAIIIPDGMRVELLSSKFGGSMTNVSFTDMIDRMNAAISKVVLSQTMTTDAQGGQYKGDVQKSVRNEVVQSDADLICDSFGRSVGMWLTEWNFPKAIPPRVWRQVEEPEGLTERAARDKVIYDMGFRPALEYIRETYGEGWDLPPAPAPMSNASLQRAREGDKRQPKDGTHFAETDSEEDPNKMPRLIDWGIEQFDLILEEMLVPVRETLDQVATLAEFNDRLPGLIKKMGITKLTDHIEQACLLANLGGRAEVLDEDRGIIAFAGPQAVWGSLPFEEAIGSFKDKVNLPTEKWNDLRGEMHARAFVSAGATRDGLLADLRSAVDAAIKDGISLQEFRKRFDKAVADHEWDFKGTRDWRSKLIMETNLRSAYSAGRYVQMTDPELLKRRPYWQYKHVDSKHPRFWHQAKNGMVLLASDPWWAANYPPNGFNCKCRVITLSERDMVRMGKTGPDPSPTENAADPGWDYNVGVATHGDRVAAKIMADTEKSPLNWKPLLPGNWQSQGLQKKLPLDQTSGLSRLRVPRTPAEMTGMVQDILGGKESEVIALNAGDFTYPVKIDAAALGHHLKLDRGPFLPYIIETIRDPREAWLQFFREETSGKVELRVVLLRAFEEGDGKAFVAVLQAKEGYLESYTAMPVAKPEKAAAKRAGELIYLRDQGEKIDSGAVL